MHVTSDPLDIYEAFTLLEKENITLLETRGKGSCRVQLFDKKGQCLLEQALEFPLEEDIEDALTALFLDKKRTKSMSKTKLQAPDMGLETTIVHKVPKVKQPKEKKERRVRKKRPLRFRITKKQLLIVSGLFLLLLISSMLVGAFIGNQTPAKEVTYEQLLQEKKYKQLLQVFPESEGKLVKRLYEQKDAEGLQEVESASKTSLASFYHAFLTKDWPKVTSQRNIPLNEETQAMRGFAYLQEDKLEEALLINQELKSDRLEKAIQEAQLKQAYDWLRKGNVAEAKQLNQVLKQEGLAKDIVTAQSVLNLIAKFEKDSKNNALTAAERKEASQNATLWRENLKRIGE